MECSVGDEGTGFEGGEECTQSCAGGFNGGEVFAVEDQVEVMRGEFLAESEADAGGGASNNSPRLVVRGDLGEAVEAGRLEEGVDEVDEAEEDVEGCYGADVEESILRDREVH